MQFQDLSTSFHIRIWHDNVAIETTGSDKGLVQALGKVCGTNHDDPIRRVKPIQFYKQLIERHFHILLILWVSRAPNCVNFIDKNYTRGALLCSREELPNSASTNADEHLLELGARRIEKRDTCFTSDCPCEQSLPGARGSYEKNAFRQLSTKSGKSLRRLQILYNFLQFSLCFVTSFYIFEECWSLLTRFWLNVRIYSKSLSNSSILHESSKSSEQ
mmetsp:Transcript_5821/g.8192  ORF Transcript_5821/g.8192 Transcript_5821/m.8192 type:complete len:217 (+) Transcript_5821:169-819(+)